jgi:hypothetical protein
LSGAIALLEAGSGDAAASARGRAYRQPRRADWFVFRSNALHPGASTGQPQPRSTVLAPQFVKLVAQRGSAPHAASVEADAQFVCVFPIGTKPFE